MMLVVEGKGTNIAGLERVETATLASMTWAVARQSCLTGWVRCGRLGLLASVFCAALALPLFATAPAFALNTHVFSSSFGSSGSGAGEMSLRGATEEVAGSGAAVNATTHDVYVADTGNARIDEFELNGTFIHAWGWGVAGGSGFETCTLTCQKGLSGANPGEFEAPVFVAVDNSAGGKGDVYVGDTGDNIVSKFTESGALVESWGTKGQVSGSSATGSGTLTEGSVTIESVLTATGAFSVGQEISGVGIPAGTAITALPGGGDVEISQPVEAGKSGLSVALAAHQAFGPLAGIAVDSVGTLDVLEVEPHGLFQFGQDGTFKTDFETPRGSQPYGLAVDAAGEFFKVDGAPQTVEELTASGGDIGTVTKGGTGEEATGLAIDAGTGDLYVDSTGGEIEHYAFSGPGVVSGQGAPTCKVEPGVGCPATDTFGSGALGGGAGLGVDPSTHTVYAADSGNNRIDVFTGPVVVVARIEGQSFSNVGATEATVRAKITGYGEPTTYSVEYGASDAYGASTKEVSIGGPQGFVSVQQALTSLQPGTLYHFRFVAHNALGAAPGADMTFTTLPAVTSSLTLPDGRAYELASGAGVPGEVYVPAGPHTLNFSTEDVQTELPFKASADGNTVAYVGDPGEVGGSGRVGKGLGNEFLATRDPQQRRWDVSDLSPAAPPSSEEANEGPITYQAFSTDLSVGFLTSHSASFASVARPEGPAPCAVLYSRTGDGHGSSDFHALFTKTQTPGSCGSAEAGAFSAEALQFAGGNEGTATLAPDTALLFQTPAPLTEGALPATEGSEGDNLYYAAGGQVGLVSVLPGSAPDPNAVFGSPPKESHSSQPDFSNVISADGSRVFWTDLSRTIGPENPDGATRLFMRENASSPSPRTVQLDAPQAGAEGTGGEGQFWTASRDGSKVLFTDCGRLTEEATAIFTKGCAHEFEQEGGEKRTVPVGNDLYQYDFTAPEGRRLTDLTVDHNGADPLRANVQGVVGSSEDGAYVYFVADGALAPGAEPRNCRRPGEELAEAQEKYNKGEITLEERQHLEGGYRKEEVTEREGHLPAGRGCNLYLFHTGETRFIATLSAKDDNLLHRRVSTSVRLGAWQPELGSRTAQVTSSGRQLVFESTQQLTGYDNSVLVPSNEGAPEEPEFERGVEIFVYDSSEGRVLCASCDPGGAPPLPEHEAAQGGTYLPTSLSTTSMRRWISEDGSRVFFDSSQPLVPQDTNGAQDVYEWEREQTPGCPVATSLSGGCVFLLSGGASSDKSFFIDADTTGDNVFFTHRGQLGQAGTTDEKMNVYDARVGGGFPQTSLACTGTGCQGVPPGPPSFATPASATFSGTGNFPPPTPPKPKTAAQIRAERLAKALKSCRTKRNRHERAVCESRVRKRYGPAKKGKNSSRAGGAGDKRRAK